MKRVKWLIALVMVVGFATMSLAGTLDEIAQRGELRVACQTQGPPFSFIDKNGKRAGSSIELCEMLAKDMGVKVTFLDFDWDGLIPALLSKKADILAAFARRLTNDPKAEFAVALEEIAKIAAFRLAELVDA